MNVRRTSIGDWQADSLAITTQFNDLRAAPKLGSQADRLEEELKHLALFQERFVIRDADFINQLHLLEMISKNHLGVHDIVSRGILLPSLRAGAEDFIEVNERAGVVRAYPARFSKAKVMLPIVQEKLEYCGAAVVLTPNQQTSGSFRANLELIIRSEHMSSSDRKDLGLILQDADPNKPLQFGKIFKRVRALKLQRHDSFLVEWCRAAHALVAAQDLGVSTSFVDGDIDPYMAAQFLSHGPGSDFDMRNMFDRFPKQIISARGLKQLTFAQITKARETNEGVELFKATARVAGARDQAHFENRMIDYLDCLENYIQTIGAESQVELTDWHKEIIASELKRREATELGLYYGIPVLMAGAGSLFLNIPALWGFAGLIGAGLQRLRDFRKVNRPTSLERLQTRVLNFRGKK